MFELWTQIIWYYEDISYGLMLDNKNSSPGFFLDLLESAHVEWAMQSFRFSFDYEMRLKTRKNVEK